MTARPTWIIRLRRRLPRFSRRWVTPAPLVWLDTAPWRAPAPRYERCCMGGVQAPDWAHCRRPMHADLLWCRHHAIQLIREGLTP